MKGSEAAWCACPLSPVFIQRPGRKAPRREQNAQQIGVNRLATSILNARFIVWRQTPARYNWPLIRVRQKVNSSLGRAWRPPLHRQSEPPLPLHLPPILPSSSFASRGLLSPTRFSLPSLPHQRADRLLLVARLGDVSPSRVLCPTA